MRNFITYTLHQLNDQVEEDEIGRTFKASGEKKITFKLLVGKPEARRPL
jgi:hypothetical protein